MKRIFNLTMVFVFLGVFSSYAGFFPSIDKPTSPDASLIALQFSIDNNGTLETYMNANWSMWAPVLKMEDGSLVEFRVNTGGADMTGIYYKENLVAGKYTLVGFNWIYTDYDKLHEYKSKPGNENHSVPKKAYDDKPYRVRQLIALDSPIEFTLEPNKMMTLGHYVIKYKVKEGIDGTSADRFRVVEDQTKIMMADSEDQSLLTYMKPWATKKWKMWNAKNPAIVE